jgi:ribA/ribD-fused uncharacterized protein
MNHKLDTDAQVCFYEQEFYVLSNFSAFTLQWKGTRFDTAEAAYHWEKFNWHYVNVDITRDIRKAIQCAPSAHEAFKIAEKFKECRRPDWDAVKVDIMRDILRAKVQQHEYVRRKLLETGDRELIEDSWRDGFWGWGENKKGQNQLGKLWMEIRDEVRSADFHIHDFVPPANDDQQQCDTDCYQNWHKCKHCGKSRQQLNLV